MKARVKEKRVHVSETGLSAKHHSRAIDTALLCSEGEPDESTYHKKATRIQFLLNLESGLIETFPLAVFSTRLIQVLLVGTAFSFSEYFRARSLKKVALVLGLLLSDSNAGFRSFPPSSAIGNMPMA